MHDQTKQLIDAILELKQEPSYFKDYLFPIVSAFFSSILGAAIAYFTLRWQENIKIEKEKMDIANKWLLIAEGARSNLLAIKSNYHGKLDRNPFNRLGLIPTILIEDNPIEVKYHELSFVVPTAKPNENTYPKWSQIPRFRAMIENYNHAIALWKQRNILSEEFKDKLIQAHGNAIIDGFSLEHALAAVGRPFLIKFIDLTERLVKLTDDLVIEIDDFLDNFPKYAKTRIRYKRLKRYGSVLTYSNSDNNALLDIIKKSPEADFSRYEALFGESHETISKRHQTGYE